MSDATSFFIARTAELVRDMTLSEAELYLSGALEIAGDIPEVHQLRRTRLGLSDCIRQLELIARAEPAVAAAKPAKPARRKRQPR